MLDFTMVIVDKITNISPEAWDEIFPDNMIEGYAYFKALDESNITLFSLHYAIVYKMDRIVSIAPLYIADFSFDTTIHGFLKKMVSSIQKIFPKFLRIKILFFGSPLTEEAVIGFSKDCDRNQILNFLNQEIVHFCKERSISVIAFYNLTKRDMPVIDFLKNNSFGCMEAYPIVRLDIKERSLEEYIQNLGKNTRKDIKRKLKKAYETDDIKIEERNNLNGLLTQAYQLYLNNFNRSDVSFEKLTVEYFSKVSEYMPGITKFFIVWINNKMVAINLCFINGDVCIDKYLGLDYDVAHKYSLYFVTWCHNIDWCIKHGVRYYQPGTGDYEPKIRLGGALIPLYICARYLNPFINRFTKPFIKLIEPKRFDPILKNHKYE
jgi:predicted N-acyltransferase